MAPQGKIGRDSEKVEVALGELAAGNLSMAKTLLMSVVRDAPDEYPQQFYNAEGGLTIRVWDRQGIIHYVNFSRSIKKVKFEISVYPRAFFYLGWISVAERDFYSALFFLKKALELEPSNAKIALEMAQAFSGLNRIAEAVAIYEAVSEVGPFTTEGDMARAMRGRGVILIEQGRLDEAEALFTRSLELDSTSEIARRELGYIAQLRADNKGQKAPIQMFNTKNVEHLNVCAVCRAHDDQGKIMETSGSLVLVCRNCFNKSTKKSWQFWK